MLIAVGLFFSLRVTIFGNLEQGQTISTGHPTGHIVNPTGLLARKYRSGVTSARPGFPQ